jgi:hypothetical protein
MSPRAHFFRVDDGACSYSHQRRKQQRKPDGKLDHKSKLAQGLFQEDSSRWRHLRDLTLSDRVSCAA